MIISSTCKHYETLLEIFITHTTISYLVNFIWSVNSISGQSWNLILKQETGEVHVVTSQLCSSVVCVASVCQWCVLHRT